MNTLKILVVTGWACVGLNAVASAQFRGNANLNRGGAAAARPAPRPSPPSINRPSITPPNIQRPAHTPRPNFPSQNGPTPRPSLPQNLNRPAPVAPRPAPKPGLVPSPRPTPLPGGGGGLTMPNRPNIPGGGPVTRPNLPGGGATTLPARPNLPGGGATTLPARPNLPGGGATTLPGQPTFPGGGGATTLPARPNLPGGGATTLPARPNLPGGGAVTLPGRPTFPGDGGAVTLPGRPTLPGGGATTLPARPNLPGGGAVTLPGRPTFPGDGGATTLPARPNLPGSGGAVTLPGRPNGNINVGNGNTVVLPGRPNQNNNIGNTVVLPGRPVPPIGTVPLPGNRPGLITHPGGITTLPIYPTYRPNQPWGGWIRPWYGGVNWCCGWVNSGSGFTWGNYYAARYYVGWHTGFWNSYFYFPNGFVPRPVPLGWLLAPNVNWNYVNPYFTTPTVTNQTFNYSQPITMMTVNEPPVETTAAATLNQADDAAQAANAKLELAREQFQDNQFDAALKLTEDALTKLPNDPTLHEFRALVLFAQGKYQDSAAAIYAVLAAGPGWNGETMIGLYDKPETYVAQLEKLETASKNDANKAELQFLLGYHYLVIGEKENAVKALSNAVRIQPKDSLSAELLKKLNE